mmetsp:Transcript_32652/g.76535  ORF Transcript_32652/g.76535 Transcript_32652/m.76535 type:complete len:202 (+) Transcript_32652:97-702(+)
MILNINQSQSSQLIIGVPHWHLLHVLLGHMAAYGALVLGELTMLLLQTDRHLHLRLLSVRLLHSLGQSRSGRILDGGLPDNDNLTVLILESSPWWGVNLNYWRPLFVLVQMPDGTTSRWHSPGSICIRQSIDRVTSLLARAIENLLVSCRITATPVLPIYASHAALAYTEAWWHTWHSRENITLAIARQRPLCPLNHMLAH